MSHYDIAIIGAGPAGCSAAINLADTGLNVAVLDACTFPRYKVCGDGLSGSVLNTLRKFPNNIAEDFLNFEPKLKSTGIRFVSPNHTKLDLPLSLSGDEEIKNPGYTCKRIDFDNFLFEHLKKLPNIEILENCKANKIMTGNNNITVVAGNKTITASVLIGADGANSVTAKYLINNKNNKRHYTSCVTAYFKNVGGLHPENFIELHFLKELLPGYFWIFPMKDNIANVGLGTLTSVVSKKRIKLKNLFDEIISKHPEISPRFKNAKKKSDTKGKSIPLGSMKRKISGERFILCGDAAGLINPLTSEGISYAMRSGVIASLQIKQCFINNDFSEKFMKQYDKEINDRFNNEFRINYIIQKLIKVPGLFNYVSKKVNLNNDLKELFIKMYTDMEIRSLLKRPSFYIKLMLK